MTRRFLALESWICRRYLTGSESSDFGYLLTLVTLPDLPSLSPSEITRTVCSCHGDSVQSSVASLPRFLSSHFLWTSRRHGFLDLPRNLLADDLAGACNLPLTFAMPWASTSRSYRGPCFNRSAHFLLELPANTHRNLSLHLLFLR